MQVLAAGDVVARALHEQCLVVVRKEGNVFTTASNSTKTRAPRSISLPETMASDVNRYPSPAMTSDTSRGYDAILLVAALEEIDARRAAIEWLMEADLLCLCLA